MARILIVVGGHLWHSPRSQKEADVWARLGHDVAIGGVWFDTLGVDRDRSIAAGKPWRFFPVIDLRANGVRGTLRTGAVRLGVRIARQLYTRIGLERPALYGYGTTAMLRAALRHNADLTIVHSEAGLWVGERLLDLGRRVGVDFEDWFSEDLLPQARRDKPLARIRELESRHAHECGYVLTTSAVLSAAMADAFSSRPPAVVYNTFPAGDLAGLDGMTRDRRNGAVPSLHWFSQNIGPGRGLEVLFRALANVDLPYECHLRGSIPEGSAAWIDSQLSAGVREKVFVHDTVPGNELLSRIAEHDIGLALETTEIKSRDLTVTNKLFQYLQAGLAVIGTATSGQKEIHSRTPGLGTLVTDNDPRSLTDALMALLGNPNLLRERKAAARAAFLQIWSWEHQAESLIREIRRVFP